MANLRRLIDLDKINPMYFPSMEMDGLDVVRYLNTLPTVDAVEVVHGEWLDSKFVRAVKGCNLPVVQCSKCECYFCDVINNHHYMYHYCPNCGAKMDGGSDG